MQLSHHFLPDMLNVNNQNNIKSKILKTEFELFKLLNRTLLMKLIFSCSAKFKRSRVYHLLDVKQPSKASFQEKKLKQTLKVKKRVTH